MGKTKIAGMIDRIIGGTKGAKDWAGPVGRSMGKGVVEGVRSHLRPLIEEDISPLLKRLRKDVPNLAREAVGSAAEEVGNVGSRAIRGITLPTAIGAGAGLAVAPEGERGEGAFRGALGGLGGGLVGGAWGRSLPAAASRALAIGGSTLGGIGAGAALRHGNKEKPMKSKFAGVTLDWYDDKGAALKAKFPTLESLPDIIKGANVQPIEKLASEDFALVALDEGRVLRKYACYDPGTTAMSVFYFMEHGDKLPAEAQKTAAANLVNACVRFNMKTAADILAGGKADNKSDSDFNPKQVEMGKKVEREHTNSPQVAAEISRDHLEEIPDYYTRLDKMEKEANVVDITGKRPTPKVKVAKPTSMDDYAVVLNGRGYYPIHTWDLVKKAEVYYQEEKGRMQPEVRRQYAVKLADKAASMGYPLDPDILDAGATNWAPKGHLKAAVEMRKIACQPGSGGREFLDELFEKRASIDPPTYAEVLRRFDVEHGLDKGWDHVILDPWASTFGLDKTADVVWEEGNDRVTDDQLMFLSQNHAAFNHEFTEEFRKEFQKDPVAIFKSLPLPQKRVIARLAADFPYQSESTQAQ